MVSVQFSSIKIMNLPQLALIIISFLQEYAKIFLVLSRNKLVQEKKNLNINLSFLQISRIYFNA